MTRSHCRTPAQRESQVAGLGAPAHLVHGANRPLGTHQSHGKAILFGEHAVVYGAPAISLPVTDLHLEARVRIVSGAPYLRSSLYTGPIAQAPSRMNPTIAALEMALARFGAQDLNIELSMTSNIPPERGLGSSSAMGAAVAGAVANLLGIELDTPTHHGMVQESERVAHGKPSGIDAHSVLADGPIWFHDGLAEQLELAGTLNIVLADTGKASDTRSAVSAVRDLHARDPRRVETIVARIAELTYQARTDLERGATPRVGSKMNEVHTLLGALGVSTPQLDALAATALDAGALGAKLTGSGRGGCLIALTADLGTAHQVGARLLGAGASAVWTTTAGGAA